MAKTISASVGFLGTNKHDDVNTIQGLLNGARKGGSVPPLISDGVCGLGTITAIRKFQDANRGWNDGRVDPEGVTLKALNEGNAGRDSTVPVQHQAGSDPSHKGPAQTHVAAKKVSASAFSWLLDKLSAIDKYLIGHARQSWGWFMWGEGTGEGSTATQLSPGGTVFGSKPIPVKEFTDIMDAVTEAIPESTSYRGQLENLKGAWKGRDPEAVATWIFEHRELFEGSEKETIRKICVAPVGRVVVGQWVAYDGSANEYVKIKFSDGSRRYVFGSRFGVYDIPDPGDMGWRQVSITAK